MGANFRGIVVAALWQPEKAELLFFARGQTTTLGLMLSLAICGICTDIHEGLVEAETAALDGLWQCQTFAMGLARAKAGDIGTSRARERRSNHTAKWRLIRECGAFVEELVRDGPDPGKDGVVRWRRVDLARMIRACSM